MNRPEERNEEQHGQNHCIQKEPKARRTKNARKGKVIRLLDLQAAFDSRIAMLLLELIVEFADDLHFIADQVERRSEQKAPRNPSTTKSCRDEIMLNELPVRPAKPNASAPTALNHDGTCHLIWSHLPH
ncbi:MAG: hypothetical protein WA869_02175 [Alloacidobacterium sp.]